MITIFHTRVLINNEVETDMLPISFVAADVLMVKRRGGHHCLPKMSGP
ncbi:MAG: hypothetical protein K8R25_03050 [Methanosarcinales archaeon]|nr:hypothetical protein [Methanosarcinales archaeon]